MFTYSGIVRSGNRNGTAGILKFKNNESNLNFKQLGNASFSFRFFRPNVDDNKLITGSFGYVISLNKQTSKRQSDHE